MHSHLMEALGAFFLVMVFGFTGDALAVGLTLMALVYIGSRVSGAHFNPAVSLAFFLKRKLSGPDLVGYVISQLLGGFLAACAIYFLSSSVFYVEPPADSNLYQQAFAEVIFTFLFVLVMLIFGISHSLRKDQIMGLVVGLTFGGMLLVSTPVSGGILNPATSIGTASLDFIFGGSSYVHTLLYTIAPLTGGALAAFAFTFLNQPSEA